MRAISLTVFVATVFVSAFLLFQVQPMLARFVLPWFGGAPAVWTVCMLFFQVVLFLGYAYAHALRKWLPVQYQAFVHMALLTLAMTFLPIVPDPYWRGLETLPPILVILLLLGSTIGVPYFLLSSTGPLLQVWFAMAHKDRSPYPLFAVSNAGSFIALLSYPFVIEPMMPVTQQVNLWSMVFVFFVLLCVGIASYTALFHRHTSRAISAPSGSPLRIDVKTKSLWVLLPACASVVLLAITNHITQDIAAIPLLWIVPLSLYLLTFILCFESDRWYRARGYGLVLVTTILALALYVTVAPNQFPFVGVTIYCVFLFASCMICHGELEKLKPAESQLTSFYLSIAAGGAMGGIFVGMIAPILFDTYAEVQLCFVIFFALVFLSDRENTKSIFNRHRLFKKAAPIATAAAVIGIFAYDSLAVMGSTTVTTRNFYGVLEREDIQFSSGAPVRMLVHGRIVHGLQFLSEERRDEPTSYYDTSSAAGRLLSLPMGFSENASNVSERRQVGVVGLGVGTLATYGRSSDVFRFYEINPNVIEFAERDFTFLSRSRSEIEIVLGDALISLERESSRNFDVLILDAFSGDAIPVHLLTLEAFQTYLRHLNEGGAIAVHITNQYFDLRPVIWALADELGLKSVLMDSPVDFGSQTGKARWVVLTNNERILTSLSRDPAFLSRDANVKPILWTDDYSNVFKVLKFNS